MSSVKTIIDTTIGIIIHLHAFKYMYISPRFFILLNNVDFANQFNGLIAFVISVNDKIDNIIQIDL